MATEVFDLETVKGVIGSIQEEFSTLSDTLQKVNTEVTTALGSPDKAVYGDAGDKILATWDENCSMLTSFMGIFDNWSNMVVSIAHEYGDLELGTAEVEADDIENFKTIANASKSNWLKTEDAFKAYKGSSVNYTNEDGLIITENKNLKDGIVKESILGSGNTNKEYYNLAKELLGTSITTNGITKFYKDNKEVKSLNEDQEKEKNDRLEKAKTNLKGVIQKREEERKNNSAVYKARKTFERELKDADEKFLSDNTFMTITNKNVNGANLRITHIIINDPSQLRTIQSNGAYGRGGESIYSMAERTDNMVVMATGAFFKDGGRQNLRGNNHIVIANGKLVDSDGNNAGGQEICIDKNGKIFYAPAGTSASDLINKYGVVDTYVSHEAQRLDNGEYQNYHAGMEWDKTKDRTYLCMVKPGEYYLIQGETTPSNAVGYAKETLGCTFAGSLEQGGAVSEVTSKGVIQKHSGYDTISNAFAIVDKVQV